MTAGIISAIVSVVATAILGVIAWYFRTTRQEAKELRLEFSSGIEGLRHLLERNAAESRDALERARMQQSSALDRYNEKLSSEMRDIAAQIQDVRLRLNTLSTQMETILEDRADKDKTLGRMAEQNHRRDAELQDINNGIRAIRNILEHPQEAFRHERQ